MRSTTTTTTTLAPVLCAVLALAAGAAFSGDPGNATSVDIINVDESYVVGNADDGDELTEHELHDRKKQEAEIEAVIQEARKQGKRIIEGNETLPDISYLPNLKRQETAPIATPQFANKENRDFQEKVRDLIREIARRRNETYDALEPNAILCNCSLKGDSCFDVPNQEGGHGLCFATGGYCRVWIEQDGAHTYDCIHRTAFTTMTQSCNVELPHLVSRCCNEPLCAQYFDTNYTFAIPPAAAQDRFHPDLVQASIIAFCILILLVFLVFMYVKLDLKRFFDKEPKDSPDRVHLQDLERGHDTEDVIEPNQQDLPLLPIEESQQSSDSATLSPSAVVGQRNFAYDASNSHSYSVSGVSQKTAVTELSAPHSIPTIKEAPLRLPVDQTAGSSSASNTPGVYLYRVHHPLPLYDPRLIPNLHSSLAGRPGLLQMLHAFRDSHGLTVSDDELLSLFFGDDGVNFAIDEHSGSGAGFPALIQRTIALQIKLGRQLGVGRFGEVRFGKWRQMPCAVKIISVRDEQSWIHEVNIYSTHWLRHVNILQFMASDKKHVGVHIELWLITEYHPYGSLYDYLSEHTLDEPKAMTILLSLMAGLQFLHTEVIGHSATHTSFLQTKPAIAHRDIKSKNIIVKYNHAVAIGDFGLAVRLIDGVVEVPKADARCGTPRYTAPECLVATDDFTTFDDYMFADVYSTGLVMWEVLRRMQILDYAAASPAEAIPFFDSVPRDPSFDHMRPVLCDKQIRPQPSPWWHDVELMLDLYNIATAMWADLPHRRIPAALASRRLELTRERHSIERIDQTTNDENEEIMRERILD